MKRILCWLGLHRWDESFNHETHRFREYDFEQARYQRICRRCGRRDESRIDALGYDYWKPNQGQGEGG